ncbi:DUF2917 domain-containing protein [Ideonella sp. YS5]|uniref:DUF2917 domain-containing protein n=1 Tax=Ideonella sp. YS5 TaxID=3453714 RepID=UPI003EEC8EED
MLITARSTRLLIEPGQSTRLSEARAARLASVAGTLWVTVDNDPRDVVLEVGDSFEIPDDASLLVSSLGGPAVMDLLPGPLRLVAGAA